MKKLYLILLAILPMWIIAQNYCLDFDGSDDYVSVPDAAGLNVTDAITVEAWVKGEGEGFAAYKRTTSAYTKYDPQFQVVGTKIYYVWHEYDGSKYQIWTAEMNTDGTNWSAAKRTSSGFDKYNPQLQVVGSKIYYVWYEMDGSGTHQIWTAEMNTNGTGLSGTKRTTTSPNKYNPQLQVTGIRFIMHGMKWTVLGIGKSGQQI